MKTAALIFFVIQILGKDVKMVKDDAREIVISAGCVDKITQSYKCDAWNALRKATIAKIGHRVDAGANAGAVVCANLDGQVVIARDEKQNETSYCKFKDGSLVSNSSLGLRALKNDHGEK